MSSKKYGTSKEAIIFSFATFLPYEVQEETSVRFNKCWQKASSWIPNIPLSLSEKFNAQFKVSRLMLIYI